MTTKIKGTYKTQSLKVGWLAGDAVCVCALSVCNQLLMGWEGCLFSWVWVCVQVGNQWRGEMVISFLKLLPKLRFWEFHEILRCSIFPMAQKLKTLELDKIGHFCWKTCSLHKILKIYTSIVTYVFLSEKKKSLHPFFAIFLSTDNTKIILKKIQNHKLVEKVVQMTEGAKITQIF